MKLKHAPTTQQFLDIAIGASVSTRKAVNDIFKIGRSRALEPVTIKGPRGASKDILYVDKEAENGCATYLGRHFGDDCLCVLGEETLWKDPDKDLSRESRIVAILDMVDGSDLLERELGNWCSAMVFFDPKTPEILFSIVQDARDRIYFADQSGAYCVGKGNSPQRLSGPQAVSSDAASVCFYAQKPKHLTTIPDGFFEWLRNIKTRNKESRLRIYTLAGNPMMAKLANGENIHVVFEHIGQHPHDAVPGLYIALRAGAHLLDFESRPITEAHLAQSLLKPSGAGLQYVLASTNELALEVAAALRPRTTAPNA
jgi:fructose-1,6-bisphosphatase/inositol monophosphatase family enzyme